MWTFRVLEAIGICELIVYSLSRHYPQLFHDISIDSRKPSLPHIF